MYTMTNIFSRRHGERMGDDYRFYYAVNDINNIVTRESGRDVGDMIADLDVLKDRKRIKDLSFYIYADGAMLYQAGEEPDQTARMLAALDLSGEHYYLLGQSALYVLDYNGYKFVVYDADFSGGETIMDETYRHTILNRMLVAFLILIIIILCTNRLLTKVVIGSIIMPLDQLIFGVRQIRDGNLTYRIEYKGKDEFKQVCDDFNEMAVYLQNSVDGRQKDYDSRKELLAGVSHDLRTPLTSIKGYIIGLEQGIDTSPQIRERYINVLKRKTEELEFLVNQLFLFSKMDIGDYPMQMRLCDLSYEMTQVVADMRIDYQLQGLDIRYQEFPGVTAVAVDLAQLKTVLFNVCENAVKYVDAPQKILLIEGNVTDGYAVIRMTDNGSGVPEESLTRLFDVFYRTDQSRNNTGRGSGLGLAISKKVIEQMNGRISAENAGAGGLTIQIELPLRNMNDGSGEIVNEPDTGH